MTDDSQAEVVRALAEVVRQVRGNPDLVGLAKIERVRAYRRRGAAGGTDHVDAYLRKRLDLKNGLGLDPKTHKAAFVAAEDRLQAQPGPVATAPARDSFTPTYPPQKTAADPGWSFQVDPFTGKNDLTMSPTMYDEHRLRVKALLKANADQATDKVYGSKDAKGNVVWSPERSAIHRAIISDIMAHALAPDSTIKRDRQAIMSGGLGGAGKSTVLANPAAGINTSQYLTINADDMKDQLIKRGMAPQIDGLEPLETAPLIHEESSTLALMLADQAEQQHLNVIWDITMGSGGSVDSRLDELESNGYDTKAVFVDVPVQTSIDRALGRHKRGVEDFQARSTGLGGRYVDPGFIEAQTPPAGSPYYSKNRANFESLKDRFYDYQIWDTTTFPPKVVETLPVGTRHRWADGRVHVKGENGVWYLDPSLT